MAYTLPHNAAKFDHDCTACTFLGHADGFDHYHCTNHAELVQRRSSDNIDYSAIDITDLTQLHPTIKRPWIVSLQLLALHLFEHRHEAMARRILRSLHAS